ncbi:MAG: DUF5320 domain-containing protein [Dehalococcoidia bacterium]|nr:DUF5320 domain-containing protein [Dehalococcoidia bacterium]
MPGFDGTGPRGLGPMTGGGRGFCGIPPGSARMAYRSGRFAGVYGQGYSGLSTQADLDQLRNEVEQLQSEIEIIEAKIKSMESLKGK